MEGPSIEESRQDVPCLLDTLAVPNLISANLKINLASTTLSTEKPITIADGTIEICYRVANKIPVAIGELKAKKDFLPVGEVPVAILILIS